MMNAQDMPLKIVGSTSFGRYPKISVEQTFNMIISDNWLVPYAGYKRVKELINSGVGRGIYSSPRLGRMIVVVDNNVYSFNNRLSYSIIGETNTFSGDVFISENNNDQIAICDRQTIYIYNWSTGAFTDAMLDFTPGYVTYQDGYFIAPNLDIADNAATWRLSAVGDGLSWPDDSQHVGAIQTKGDYAQAAVRVPGKGNLLLVFGKTVAEPWYDVGAKLFPYQRSTSSNIDYGVANASTIAESEEMVAWVGSNEKSGPVIMYSTGTDINQISNDGINFRLAQLNNPSNAYGFFFKQDGHLFYQVTFPDPRDNLTLTFDFNTQKIFTLTDENMAYHIAKRVAFFNNAYYFVSFNDGNLYELSSNYTDYDYGDGKVYEIPRIRTCPTLRLPDGSPFSVNSSTFILEQGTDPLNVSNTDYQPRVDMSMSKDGGESFGSDVSKPINRIGKRKNRMVWWAMGRCNEYTPQFRFVGLGRFVATDGITSIYQ